MEKRGEYKIKEKHIIKLSKLYEEVKEEIDRLMDEWTGIFEDLRAIEADMKDDM